MHMLGLQHMVRCKQLCTVTQLTGQRLHDILVKQLVHLWQTELHKLPKQQEVHCRLKIGELAWLMHDMQWPKLRRQSRRQLDRKKLVFENIVRVH